MTRKIVALLLLALLSVSARAQGELVLARVQWLDGLRLAVTTCEGDVCRTAIADLPHHKIHTVEFGPYLPEAYLEWRDSYIVSRVSDGAIGLWDSTGQFRPYASGEQVARLRQSLRREESAVRPAPQTDLAGIHVGTAAQVQPSA